MVVFSFAALAAVCGISYFVRRRPRNRDVLVSKGFTQILSDDNDTRRGLRRERKGSEKE